MTVICGLATSSPSKDSFWKVCLEPLVRIIARKTKNPLGFRHGDRRARRPGINHRPLRMAVECHVQVQMIVHEHAWVLPLWRLRANRRPCLRNDLCRKIVHFAAGEIQFDIVFAHVIGRENAGKKLVLPEGHDRSRVSLSP